MKTTLFWFRRDLRLHDNAGPCAALRHASRGAGAVHCVFVFDRDILDQLPSKTDRRVEFIVASVVELQQELRKSGGDLHIEHASAVTAIPALAARLAVDAVFANDDYEPYAIARDTAVADALSEHGITLRLFKDTVVFEKNELLTQAGKPFSVFTPYKNAWLKRLTDADLTAHSVTEHLQFLASSASTALKSSIPHLSQLGFLPTNIHTLVQPGMSGAAALLSDFVERMADYKQARDFPAIKGVSYLSVHNRFGTISVRELASIAYAETLKRKNSGAETWLAELIWRDFYFQILWHTPHVATRCYRPQYDALAWENNKTLFSAWCESRTGYPIIDAAMRQINQTGYMHNRLRMVVASFLTKDLLIDWRWGEKYFADNLNDFDLSANNGGWQWAASTGCDAQPYFRIFNPVTQSERFDPQGKFIRRYLPELKNLPDKFVHAPWTLPPIEAQALNFTLGRDYPAPIVDHAVQRDKALAMFKAVRDLG